MSRNLRRLLVLAAMIVVVVVGVRLLVARLVPAKRIAEEVAASVREATGAEVEIGSVDIRLLPRIAVRVEAGAIRGTGAALAAATGAPNDVESYSLEIAGLSAALKPGALLRGRIETGPLSLECPRARIALQDEVIELEGLEVEIADLQTDMAKIVPASGPAAGASPPGEAIPEDLSLTFRVRIERLNWQRADYEAVECAGELDGRVISVDELSARRATGTITGIAEIDYDRDPWGELDFEVVVDAVPAVALLEPWAPSLGEKLECDLSGEVSGGCSLRDAETSTASLDLTGRVQGDEGVLRAEEWLVGIVDYLGDRKDLQDIRFRSLQHTFRVSQERYRVEELELEGPDTDWSGSGWVGFDGTIDLDLAVKLPAGFTPDLGQLSFLAEGLRDDEGRVNLTLHLSGQSARPKVGLKLGALGGSASDGNRKGLGGFLDKLKTK